MLKALSIKQPWAYAILHLGKDIENRTWHTNYMGDLLVHASKTVDEDALARLRVHPDELALGAVIGIVRMTGCTHKSDSKWFEGPWGFTLENPRAFPEPVPCRGMLNFFKIEESAQEAILAQLRIANECR